MKPLPPTRYEYAEWSKVKVSIDYHVDGERHYYSVPHALVGEYVMVRFTDTTVECFFKGGRVAVHVRSYQVGKFTTLPEHMPKCAPKTHEMDARAAPELGPEHRRRHACRRAVAAREPAPPRARLPRVLGVAEPVQDLRRGASGGGVSPRAHHRLHRIASASWRSSTPSSTSIPTSSPPPTRRPPPPSRTHGNVRGADYFRRLDDERPKPQPLTKETMTHAYPTHAR